LSYQLDTASISDGVHTLGVVATQQDDLSTSAYISFSTDTHYISAQNAISDLIAQLNAANATINSLSSQLNAANATIGSLSSHLSNAQTTLNEQGKSTSQLESEATALTIGFCGSVALAAVALIVAFVAVRRKKTAEPLR
jgi:chromosome segregation ATPase